MQLCEFASNSKTETSDSSFPRLVLVKPARPDVLATWEQLQQVVNTTLTYNHLLHP